MPRPRRFSDDDVLDAALAAVAEHGRRVTLSQITAALGAPVGSVYYRFPSRDHLLASLWLRGVARFQEGLFQTLLLPDPQEALERSARHVVRYCHEHPQEAIGLTLYRQERLLADCPDGLHDAVATCNDRLYAAFIDVTRRRYGSVARHYRDLCRTAVQIMPYGLVRPYLGGPVPDYLEDAAAVAARAILTLGDDSPRARRPRTPR